MFTSERGFLVLFFGTWLSFSFSVSFSFFSFFTSSALLCSARTETFCTVASSTIVLHQSWWKTLHPRFNISVCRVFSVTPALALAFLESTHPVSILRSKLIFLRSSVDLSLLPSFFDGYQRIRGLLIVDHNFGILSQQVNNKNIQCIQHSPPLQPLGFLYFVCDSRNRETWSWFTSVSSWFSQQSFVFVELRAVRGCRSPCVLLPWSTFSSSTHRSPCSCCCCSGAVLPAPPAPFCPPWGKSFLDSNI